MNRILGIDHSRIVDLLQVLDISCTKLYDRRVGDQGTKVKSFPCRQVGIPTRGGGGGGGGDFHFQHGFYEMWVTKALNGDREQAQLFLAFGSGYVGRERFPTARAQSACAGGRLPPRAPYKARSTAPRAPWCISLVLSTSIFGLAAIT